MPYSNLEIQQFKQGATIAQNLLGQRLKFNTRYGVFSPKSIDAGTLLLLDYLKYQLILAMKLIKLLQQKKRVKS